MTETQLTAASATGHDGIARRRFLTVGASAGLVAAGALLLTPHRLQASNDDHAAQMAGLGTELAAILNRRGWDRAAAGCSCAGCAAALSAAFQCVACGFTGTPFVFPCDCGVERGKTIEYWQLVVDRALPLSEGISRRQVKRWLQRLRRASGPDRCDTANAQCAHGCRDCPVCSNTEGDTAGTGAFQWNEGTEDAASIIRDVRRALTARGIL